MLFILKSGTYRSADGVLHVAGEPSGRIVSDERLDLKFKNKFIVNVDQFSSSPVTSVAAPVVTDVVSANAALLAAQKAVAEATKVAEAMQAEVVAKAKAVEEAAKPTGAAAEALAANEALAAKLKAKALAATPLGMNVTLLFGAAAKDKTYTIHKNGEMYDIANSDGARLNDDPLNKELVEMYLKNNA